MQLLSLAFPIKMLVTLLMVSWLAAMFPRLMREISGHSWSTTHRMLGI